MQAFEPHGMATPPSPVCRADHGSTGAPLDAQSTDLRTNEFEHPESRHNRMSHQIDGDISTWCHFAQSFSGSPIAGEQQSVPTQENETLTAPEPFAGHNFDTTSTSGNGQPFVSLTGGTSSRDFFFS